MNGPAQAIAGRHEPGRCPRLRCANHRRLLHERRHRKQHEAAGETSKVWARAGDIGLIKPLHRVMQDAQFGPDSPFATHGEAFEPREPDVHCFKYWRTATLSRLMASCSLASNWQSAAHRIASISLPSLALCRAILMRAAAVSEPRDSPLAGCKARRFLGGLLSFSQDSLPKHRQHAMPLVQQCYQ